MVFGKERKQKKAPSERRYKIQAMSLLGAAALAFSYSALSLWRMHVWDKYVTKSIEIAANVPSLAQENGGLSMESSLHEAYEHVSVSPLSNPAIIWSTPLTEISVFKKLVQKAVERCTDIHYLETSFQEGKIKEAYPDWVKKAYEKLHIPQLLRQLSVEEQTQFQKVLPTLEQLAQSEYGQRVGSEYENLNSIVGGGTRTTAKNLEENHRSLLDTLEKAAGWRSIIRFQADDFKQAYAHIFIGYLQANMGYLNEALENFQQAKTRVDEYPDDKNLSLFRDTPDLELKTIKGMIDSSIQELTKLESDQAKYSTGWWKRLRYYNKSIGGQADPSIQDVSEAIYDRYGARFRWVGNLGLGLLYFAGRFARRYRKMREYQVLKDEPQDL